MIKRDKIGEQFAVENLKLCWKFKIHIILLKSALTENGFVYEMYYLHRPILFIIYCLYLKKKKQFINV